MLKIQQHLAVHYVGILTIHQASWHTTNANDMCEDESVDAPAVRWNHSHIFPSFSVKVRWIIREKWGKKAGFHSHCRWVALTFSSTLLKAFCRSSAILLVFSFCSLSTTHNRRQEWHKNTYLTNNSQTRSANIRYLTWLLFGLKHNQPPKV